MRRLLLFACALAAGALSAADEFDTSVDRSDPKFVTASLMTAGPGETLFSCVGHSFIRLECPHYKLDYCFSYESEGVRDRLAAFFAGRLKMGLFAVPTEEFLAEYRRDGRGVWQYELNLPPDVEQRLWKIIDERAAEGANLPYDYNRRGCAKSAWLCIREALEGAAVEYAPWNPATSPSRREKFNELLAKTHPWNLLFLNAIVGTETDNFEEVVTPKDLVAVLRKTRVGGVPLIVGEGRQVAARTLADRPVAVTPLAAAIGFLVVCIAGVFWKKPYLGWALVALQAAAGCFFLYLMTASRLPTSSWNWLIVPFNPLPLVFWRWRRRWGRWAAAGLAVWAVAMLAAPHQLTDPAFVVLALGFAVGFVGLWYNRPR